jgi:hypothetical protein
MFFREDGFKKLVTKLFMGGCLHYFCLESILIEYC